MSLNTPAGGMARVLTRSHARYVVATIFLCVTVLVAVAATAQLLRSAMAHNARQLLGADLRLQASWPLPSTTPAHSLPDALWRFAQEHLAAPARRLSPSLEFNAMLRPMQSDRSLLVEVKAVAADYPLRGAVQLQHGQTLAAALHEEGIVVEATLLQRLGLTVGQRLELGDAQFTIRGVLAYEPDRLTRLFRLGPSVIIPLQRVAETGLLQMGSRVTQVVAVAVAPGEEASTLAHSVRPEALQRGIRLLTPEQSQPSLQRFLRRFILFLAMTALLTLLLGGLAIQSALAAWLRENRQNIAILKLIGADNPHITRLIVYHVGRLSGWASLGGALLGSALPALLPHILPELLPTDLQYAFPWGLILAGTLFGLLFSLVCVLAPLLWSRRLSPAALFRLSAGGMVADSAAEQHPLAWSISFAVLAGMALAIGLWSGEVRAAVVFVLAVLVALVVAWGGAYGVLWLLRRWPHGPLPWRLACQSLLRRGERQALLLMALAVALGLVSALFFLEDNLNQQLLNRLPQRIPSFFFIDLQPDQVEPFQQIVQRFALPQEESVRLLPTVRGRLQQENRLAIEEDPDQTRHWRQAREYVLTFAEALPSGNRLLHGEWWHTPEALEASVEVEMAKELGWRVGDRIAFMVQGVKVEAVISNLRAVRWSDFSLNFFVIFSPAVLQAIPPVWMASVAVAEAEEEALLTAVTGALPNVTAVATRQVLQTIHDLVQQVAGAARVLAVAALLAGLLLLAVQVGAARRRRRRELALYRLIGATRAEVARILAAEMALLAVVAAVLGVLIGQLLCLLIVRGLFNDLAVVAFWPTVLAVFLGAAVIFAAAWWASQRHLDQPVLATLRAPEG
ncbi:MAG: FtsX-like permease family protein [Magnetococcales bacterium]|nr:FtsX-like permease family protein [Magnetococcales bacterium]MBF0115550.1 FtsX-like permease family protein [Magnetococcales bacterium]